MKFSTHFLVHFLSLSNLPLIIFLSVPKFRDHNYEIAITAFISSSKVSPKNEAE